MIPLQGRVGRFRGRPVGRKTGWLSLGCFEGFALCQHQDPTEEDLPFGVWGRWEAQPLKALKAQMAKGESPWRWNKGFLLVLVLIYDCLFNRSSFNEG